MMLPTTPLCLIVESLFFVEIFQFLLVRLPVCTLHQPGRSYNFPRACAVFAELIAFAVAERHDSSDSVKPVRFVAKWPLKNREHEDHPLELGGVPIHPDIFRRRNQIMPWKFGEFVASICFGRSASEDVRSSFHVAGESSWNAESGRFPTISPMDLLEAKAKSRQIKSRQARAMLSGDRIETSDSSTCTGWSPQRKQDSECPS